MKTIYAVLLSVLSVAPLTLLKAQTDVDGPIVKKFETPQKFGDASLHSIRHEVVNNFPCVVYEVELQMGGAYVVQSLGNFSPANTIYVTQAASGALPPDLDPNRARNYLKAGEDGWQAAQVMGTSGEDRMFLPVGRFDLYFFTRETAFPLTDRISITPDGSDAEFDENVTKVNEQIQLQIERGPSFAPKEPNPNARVIPNPAGNYSHEVNEWYNYSTFNYLYLTAGSLITLETSNTVGGTSDPVLHLFDPNNPDARSWTDDDSGPGLESKLSVVIPVTATYVLLVRPYYGYVTATTKIFKNSVLYLNNTPVGGRLFTHTAYTGLRNFFTSYMVGDTRLFTLNGIASNVRGYNDDYWGPGTFAWGLRSRITKNFPTAINTTYVCAYSTSIFSSGITDTYMGNPNGAAYSWFPSYNANDCIQSAPFSGAYNCISWSGGVTATWIWPPSDPAYNTGAVPELITFDRYYSNTPKRFTGAWDYNRGGANVGNAVIDLWKVGSGLTGYTHASVKKPGNNNPHGYDWESKPGSLDRCFHPRNALNGPSYGAVTDYYVFAGTFAKNAAGQPATKDIVATDADAVRLGYDVYETVRLSNNAQTKLTTLLGRTSPAMANEFARRYDAWKATWGNFAYSSNPEAYTKNNEYNDLYSYSKNNGDAVLPLLFNRYIQGDFLSTPLLWKLTLPNYEPLLKEVRDDILANPNDEQGRHIIRSTFGNNVLYIEKILRDLQTAAPFTVTVSPNPVIDRMNVDVTLTAESKVSINVSSAQTGAKVAMVRETSLPAGTHRFTTSVKQMAGSTGDMILVQVQVDGALQTVKVLVGQ